MASKTKINYWLVKQEPEDYSWENFVKDGRTAWTGVRNFQARKNLSGMSAGDRVLYYHSGKDKAIVGIAEVVKDPYPDPTAKEGEWIAVDLKPVKKLASSVTLAELRQDKRFADFVLLRQSRLSVMPVSKEHYELLISKR